MLFSYFINMLTSHLVIIRDFEFYNLAIINKYFMEAIAGIYENKDDLERHFSELTYDEWNERMNKRNSKITQSVERTFGKPIGEIYRKLNAFAHPIEGPMYGMNIFVNDRRDLELLAWLTYSYEKGIMIVFEILGIECDISYMDEVHKWNRVIEEVINEMKEGDNNEF